MNSDLAVIEETEVAPANLFGTHNPQDIVTKSTEVADALKDVLGKKGLVKRISNREFVVVEGWTLLGTMLGVFPVVAWSRMIRDEEGRPHGWEARVEARTLAGAVVGAAEAQCTRDEGLWGWHPRDRNGRNLQVRDDYALRSMAQTRAVSKALRAPLGFIVTMAGYEATPADEVPDDAAVEQRDADVPVEPDENEERRLAIGTLGSALKHANEHAKLPPGVDNWADALRAEMMSRYGVEEGQDWRQTLTPAQMLTLAEWLAQEEIPF